MVKQQLIEENYALYNGDCIEVMKTLPKDNIYLSIYSPPFGGLYHYSSDERDLSNSKDYADFFNHYRYVIREIWRITLPGRMTAIHCVDIPKGSLSDKLIDFSGDIVKLHESEKWDYVARYSIWNEPLMVRNRTMAKSLAHKTIVDDSSKCSNAGADYLLIFRKKGENKIPIQHPQGIIYYAGSRKPPSDVLKYKGYEGKQIENKYSHWIWRQYASAFWDDIRKENVLPFKESRDDKDEKHVHPLQLDIIDRCCELWSNPNEVILSPFAGVGSEIYGAVSYGRKGIGIELKESYYDQSIKNLKEVNKRFIKEQSVLF